jgi:phosphatidylserine/phosphatidylglycerophosphate/cardiolipin synthase-like enzyme
MKDSLSLKIHGLIQQAPKNWLDDVSSMLRTAPATASADFIKKRIPSTANANLAFLLAGIINSAESKTSWESLGYGLMLAFDVYTCEQAACEFEMLWSGPQPANHLPARRIDQALYDLIAVAKHQILLVTFAAVKVHRLVDVLLIAASRGVKIQLVFEFSAASEGQLTFDAIKAFPDALLEQVHVYFWPVEKRDRNQAGKPGKLHAKLAVVDDVLLLSSANLTDDAFSRNLELGVQLTAPDAVNWTKDYFAALINDGTLRRLQP